jgi:glycerophosphoryl diester phosphodiesterase
VPLFTIRRARLAGDGAKILSRPLVVAHRGASRAVPPGNTVAAFRMARTLGAEWVELDVRASADGRRVVHHDAELSDGRAICELACSELPSFVPELDVALTSCAGMGVNVEIKNSPGDVDFDSSRALAGPVVESLRDFDRTAVLVTSFDPRSIDRVRDLDPTIPTGLLAFDLEDPGPVIDAAVAGGHSAINPWDPYVDAEFMAQARAVGLAVNVWTVNDPDRMRELVSLGVDAIITDVPDVLRQVIDCL